MNLMETVDGNNGIVKQNTGITKCQAGELIFELFNNPDSGDINVDINFSKKSIELFLKEVFSGKQLAESTLDRILKRCFVVDLVLDVNSDGVHNTQIQIITSGNKINIHNDGLFLNFCKLHTLLPWIRKITINNSQQVFLNDFKNLEYKYRLLFHLLADAQGDNYYVIKQLCDEYFEQDQYIFGFIQYIEELKNLRTDVVKKCSNKLVNRSIYEVLLTEVFYKNKSSFKKNHEFLNLDLATFRQDHEDKIDNVLHVLHPIYGKKKIGIQLTAFENVDKKIEKVMPYVQDNLFVLSLNDGLECLTDEGDVNGNKLSSRITSSYDDWINKWLKRGKNTGHFPFFVYRLENEIEDIILKNIKVMLEFVIKVVVIESNWIDRFKDIISMSQSPEKDVLIDNLSKVFCISFSKKLTGLSFQLEKSNDLLQKNLKLEGIGEFMLEKCDSKNGYEYDKLIIRGKIKNQGINIGELVYIMKLKQ